MKSPNGKRNGGRSNGKNGKKPAGAAAAGAPDRDAPGKASEKGPVRPVGPPGAASNVGSVIKSACTPEQIAARDGRRPVNLALQGGGAHGAFTWGVLDKLLEDDTLALDAISATSAGAMNAVVMAYGMAEGGREVARQKLEAFWRAVAEAGAIFSPLHKTVWDRFLPSSADSKDTSQVFMAFQAFTQLWSPYQLNPFDFNPLKDVLSHAVDFDKLKRSPHATRLFINATNVRTGKVRVFENADVSLDVVLASACLPNVFRAVEIGKDAYWDGGFMGNPPLFPLIYGGASEDIVIVHINPIEREALPTTAPEIADRMNEISFNSLLMSELRAIAFVARLVKAGSVDETRYRQMRIHSIRDEKEMSKYGVASKLDPDWDFLCHLRDIGRRAADRWLKESRHKVGVESSIDVSRFL